MSIEELKKKLEKAIDNNKPKSITVLRGRYIKKIKEKIRNEKDKNKKEELEELLKTELANHKKQIEERYKKEFRKEKKNFKSLITVLPKGVVLAAKKVIVCINELKLSKTMKERIFKSLNLAGATAKLIGTPIDYSARFAIRHWYLILLLLSLKLPKIDLNKKNKGNKENNTNTPTQEQPETEEAATRQTIPVEDPNDLRREHLDVVKNTRPAREVTPTQVKPAIPVEDPNDLRREHLDVVKNTRPAREVEYPQFNFEEGTEAYNNFQSTIERINERTNGKYYIRELAENQDIYYATTPEEYLTKCGKSEFIDPITKKATDAGYEEIYRLSKNPMFSDSRMTDIIFSDPEHKYLNHFKDLGLVVDNSEYFAMEGQKFETVNDFIKALQQNSNASKQLREDFLRCMSTSETQEALQALGGLAAVGLTGELVAGTVSLALQGNLPAIIAKILAAGNVPLDQILVDTSEQTEWINFILKTIKEAPSLAQNILGYTGGTALAFR